MLKRLSFLFCILSPFFIFPGCAIQQAHTVSHISDNIFLPPQVILEKIDRDDQCKDALKAIAHIEVNTLRGRYPVKAALMVKRPSSLRLEILPLLGPPELILSVHENVLKVFLPQKGEFYIGQASEKNMAYFFPFPMQGLVMEDIISILLGTHPTVKEESLTFRGSHDEGFYRVDILSENRKIQSLLIDIENNKLMRVNLFDNDNNPRYSVRFFGQSVTENLTIPDTITLASGYDENPYITIKYSDAQRAMGVDAASFDLQPPPNVTIISMD
jgi:outer membrane lipoprotein-sorting protein